tara:strand:+ start:2525 stop:2857 length:333 start_codon:yes stop_codon:yes gene_type:complete
MDFNTQVTDDFIKQVCEGEAWKKANVKVARIEEAASEVVEAEEEAEEVEVEAEEAIEEETSFSLEDLEFVLDNLEDDALLEHAATMLDLFDAANEHLLNEEEDEEEEEEE